MDTDTIHHDLKLSGPLTTAGANDIRGLIAEALETSNSVRIDVSAVTDIDLSFLQTLIAAHKTAKLERKSLTVLASGSEALAVQISDAACRRPSFPISATSFPRS